MQLLPDGGQECGRQGSSLPTVGSSSGAVDGDEGCWTHGYANMLCVFFGKKTHVVCRARQSKTPSPEWVAMGGAQVSEVEGSVSPGWRWADRGSAIA